MDCYVPRNEMSTLMRFRRSLVEADGSQGNEADGSQNIEVDGSQ